MTQSDPAQILRDQLQSTFGASYSIERELDGAGMSRVFVASEARLGRRVVVKVLAPELAAGISADRFEREIRIIASLQQANIVPLLTAGHTAGLPYYTMPFVEGRSLRDRLAAGGPLPVGEALGILRDIARALAYAHEHGVVHRDVKPGNVLLSGGAAVVTDFGIAKALSVARTAEMATLTGIGAGVGTPAYMAPEQAAGDPDVDHRADVYALGCVAYELLTGAPPFHGRAVQRVIAAHLSEVPPLVTKARPEVPGDLAALIARCLEKTPSRRPQDGGHVLRALEVMSSRPPAVGKRGAALRIAAAALVVAAVGAAGAYAVRRAGDGRGASSPSGIAVAVLPFINVGGDSAQEYLADGIGDELTTALGKVRGVEITGRSAAQRYRGRRDIDSRDVGRALGAQYLVQGTLRQAGGRLSVSVQLANTKDGDELWADDFNKAAQDLEAVKDSIVRAIRERLGVGAGAGDHTLPAQTVNPDAYGSYLMGEYLMQRRGSGVSQAVVKFEQAIKIDPRYARAYAGLAQALNLLPYFTGVPVAGVSARAMAAAQRAIALDSTIAGAHTALGEMYWYGMLWDQAEQEFRTAVRLDPNEAEAHILFGRFYVHIGRLADALAEFQRAGQIDRTSAIAASWAAYATFLSGQRDAGLAQAERALQLDSTMLPAVNIGTLLYVAAGKRDAARRAIDRFPVGSGSMSNAPYIYAATGDTTKAMRLLRAEDARQPRPWFSDVDRATVMIALGDTARALDLLEQSEERTGPLWTDFLPNLNDPAFDPIRGSARFAAIARRAGLDTRSNALAPAGKLK